MFRETGRGVKTGREAQSRLAVRSGSWSRLCSVGARALPRAVKDRQHQGAAIATNIVGRAKGAIPEKREFVPWAAKTGPWECPGVAFSNYPGIDTPQHQRHLAQPL